MQKPEDYIGHHTDETERQARLLAGEEVAEESESQEKPDDGEWLQLARDGFRTSDDWFNVNIRPQIEKNLQMFQSKHPSGSKYHLDSYKHRSKLFRPKTRAIIRRMEAAGALALFGTVDTVTCVAENQRDPEAVAGAACAQNLLSYRLEHTIPWFLTAIGGLQDALVTGIVASRQEWKYLEEEGEEPEVDEMGNEVIDETGTAVMRAVPNVIEDRPLIDLLPIENLRWDPAADWRDIAGTSPYIIELMPMYIYQVIERAEHPPKDTAPWRKYSAAQIQGAMKTGADDSTRQVREGKREDSKEVTHTPNLYDICWVHRNVFKHDGEDWVFYTIGTTLMLSDPVPVTNEFLHGRPYKIGFINLETHKTTPAGHPELGEGLQIEANDTINQRIDNIRLAINRRHYAKRGVNTDWRALMTSTPGGVVLMDDLNDVKPEPYTDVTSSSYQEQDRLNVDFDDLMGGFSTGSVMTNRSMNETVGGMSMALDDSNVLSEYQLRMFVETWVEPVLKQTLEMERQYESNQDILMLAGDGQMTAEQVDALLKKPISVRVAVGFGATSPSKRVEKLSMGLNTVATFLPGAVQNLNDKEIIKEVFGALGFRDGSRFFKTEDQVDPQVAELQQQMQEMQKMLDTQQARAQASIQVAQIKAQTELQREQMRLAQQQDIESYRIRLEYIDKQIKAETNDIKRGELVLEQDALMFQKEQALQGFKERELQLLTEESNRLSEVLMNNRYGLVPDAEDPNDGKKPEGVTP